MKEILERTKQFVVGVFAGIFMVVASIYVIYRKRPINGTSKRVTPVPLLTKEQ